MKDFDEFCETFDLIENAMSMRNMQRWNGRDMRTRENLSEHTHLVLVCAIKICQSLPNFVREKIDFETLTKVCLIHDSLEMLRGDILSITKDTIPNLRKFVTEEEDNFILSQLGEVDDIIFEVCTLADLMACYKFIEFELRYPSNDFAKKAYLDCRNKYEKTLEMFNKKHNIETIKTEKGKITLSKAYENDAGVDIIMDEDITFMPNSTVYKMLELNICPNEGEMAILCSRSSASIRGLIVAMCPIDSGYSGNITAIVTNVSNDIIEYKKGESFCQVIFIPINDNKIESEVRKLGKRGDGKLGSTL